VDAANAVAANPVERGWRCCRASGFVHRFSVLVWPHHGDL